MLGEGILGLVRATYFKDASRRTEAYASPLRADDVADLPPTMVVTAERDLLRREGDAYADRLARGRCPGAAPDAFPVATTTSSTGPMRAPRST